MQTEVKKKELASAEWKAERNINLGQRNIFYTAVFVPDF